MPEGPIEAIARVRRLLQCARDVYARREVFEAELLATTGLSAEGGEAAWTHCLERSASDADLQALVGSVRAAPEVFVVLSAHVFTASLRALALSLAASARVHVLPSRRDPVLARELVAEWNGPELSLAAEWPSVFAVGSTVHAYGNDASLQVIRTRLPEHADLWGHGTGFAVAYVHNASIENARALALDVALFDQRGCLSPRVVWAADPMRFGAKLSDAMREIAIRIPVGELLAEERVEHSRFRESAEFAVASWCREGGMVSVGAAPLLPPTGRVLHVVGLDTPLPEAWRGYLTQVVGDGAAPAWMPPHARFARPGNAQSPPFDGPVDRRSVAL